MKQLSTPALFRAEASTQHPHSPVLCVCSSAHCNSHAGCCTEDLALPQRLCAVTQPVSRVHLPQACHLSAAARVQAWLSDARRISPSAGLWTLGFRPGRPGARGPLQEPWIARQLAGPWVWRSTGGASACCTRPRQPALPAPISSRSCLAAADVAAAPDSAAVQLVSKGCSEGEVPSVGGLGGGAAWPRPKMTAGSCSVP